MIKVNDFFKTRNLTISLVLILSTIFFLILEKFSFFSWIILIFCLISLYFYLQNKMTEILRYLLVFILCVIVFSTVKNDVLCSILIGIIFAGMGLALNTGGQGIDLKIIYSVALLLIATEISYSFFHFAISNESKGLFFMLIFYFLTGLIDLSETLNLKLLPISKYCIIFITTAILLLTIN